MMIIGIILIVISAVAMIFYFNPKIKEKNNDREVMEEAKLFNEFVDDKPEIKRFLIESQKKQLIVIIL